MFNPLAVVLHLKKQTVVKMDLSPCLRNLTNPSLVCKQTLTFLLEPVVLWKCFAQSGKKSQQQIQAINLALFAP